MKSYRRFIREETILSLDRFYGDIRGRSPACESWRNGSGFPNIKAARFIGAIGKH